MDLIYLGFVVGLQAVHLKVISTFDPLITLAKVEVYFLKLGTFPDSPLSSFNSVLEENSIPDRSSLEYGGKALLDLFSPGFSIFSMF